MRNRIEDIEKYMGSWVYHPIEDKPSKREVVYEFRSNEIALSDILKISSRESCELFISTNMRPVPYEDYDEPWVTIEKDVPLSDIEHLEYLEDWLIAPYEVEEWKDYERLYKKFIGV